MARCGLDPEQYFGHEDFLSVFDWNTPAAVSALGTAVSEVSEQVLRHIEVTIKRYEREKITERSQNHGERADLHTERGLSDPDLKLTEEPEAAPLGKYGRMRRQHLKEHRPILISEAGAGGEAVPAPAGDRRDGPPASVRDDAADGEGGGRDGGVESSRPNEVAGLMNTLKAAGGGDHPERAGIQLTGQEQQLTLFPSEQEQRQSIAEAESVETPSAFSISDAEWDAELRPGVRQSGRQAADLRPVPGDAGHKGRRSLFEAGIRVLLLPQPNLSGRKPRDGDLYHERHRVQALPARRVHTHPMEPGGGTAEGAWHPLRTISLRWKKAAGTLSCGAFSSAGNRCRPRCPAPPYPPPMQPEQLTLDALITQPAAETVSPPPASLPPFHEKYLPEILRHEDGSATWEALTKFFADHPEEHLRVSYLQPAVWRGPASVPGQRWDHHRFSWFPGPVPCVGGQLSQPYRYYPPDLGGGLPVGGKGDRTGQGAGHSRS